jgi:hypothetical protein
MARTGRRIHSLDNEEMQKRLSELQRFRRQARLAHLDNRRQQAIDADYFDGIQLTDETLSILEEREQPIQVWNITKSVVNWAINVQEKMPFDTIVLPRRKLDEKDAKTKTKIMKYLSDANYSDYIRSEAFKHAIKVGVGWLDLGARQDQDNPLYYDTVDWRDMWFDNLGKKPDLTDWRYMFMERWIDLDIAEKLFEDRAKELGDCAQDTNSRYPYNPEDAYVFDDATDGVSSDYGMTFGQTIEGYRNRVKLVHMQYRLPAGVKVLNISGSEYGAAHGAIYRPDDELHQHLVKYSHASLEDAKRMTMRHAIWCNGIYLADFATPYNHNKFTWIPIFCYRRDRDGMPYGLIRDLRSPQDDVNARKARAFFLMSSEKVIYEEEAILGNIEDFRDEYLRPDGVVRVAKGALSGNRIHFENGITKAQQHLAVSHESEQFMHNISGQTGSLGDKAKKKLSGVAMEHLEAEGAASQGTPFLNYFFSLQLAGEIELSNIEQFFNMAMTLRITGDVKNHEFVDINAEDENGEPVNSVTRFKADFKVSKTQGRETVRKAMLDSLQELIIKLMQSGPEGQKCAMAMLDVYVDLWDDLPSKDELVERVRKITGQDGTDEDLTPEQLQAKQQERQQLDQMLQAQKALQQKVQQLEMDGKQAKIDLDKSKALETQVKAWSGRLVGFMKAMDAAAATGLAPELVAAADSLIEDAEQMLKMPLQPAGQAQLPAAGGVIQ